ncbi:MAG: DUF4091 domain-containing protein [Clostridia bacterium]|nr:DUF4091 domain-containing protein [Clostridia bacterium]
MNLTVKQISDLHKISTADDLSVPDINSKLLLQGESFSYQIVMYSDKMIDLSAKITSTLKDFITLYRVDSVIIDLPMYPKCSDDNYITHKPGYMPDLLTPINTERDHMKFCENIVTIWVKVDLPKDIKSGNYEIDIEFDGMNAYTGEKVNFIKKMKIEIINAQMPEQKTKFTQWFHTDCISSIHNVEIYSEKHWELIDKYMAMASQLGINMLLTPVITPPLDTEVGITRPNVQLVKIEKKGDKYIFGFELLKRWIDLCKKNGIKYYEISHLFSQWGLKFAPNIYIYENGVGSYIFGWHVASTAPEYADFLRQFIPELVEFLKSEGIADSCYFHISDEPHAEHLEAYSYAKNLIKPLIGDIKTIDALSDTEFFKTGTVEIPVPKITAIHDFLDLDTPEKWVYYCCSHGQKVSNRFMAMPSARTRIVGLQMYKYRVEGFLQWGYNFYYSQYSRSLINPYVNTSANGAFPSGDAFTVYPGVDGPLPSLRGFVFQNALQDIEICRLLESYIGHDEVVKIIEDTANMTITFNDYPAGSDFIPEVMDIIKQKIKEVI